MSIASFMRCNWFLLAALALFLGCGVEKPPTAPADGQALAVSTCTRCHTLPPPSFLSRDEWPYLLAWMGNYLGHAPDIEIHPALVDKTLVPKSPLVTREEFDAIRGYYLEQAALQYQLPPLPPKPAVSPVFEPVPFPLPASEISMVAIDSANQTLLIGTSRMPGLLVLQRGITTPIAVPSEPVTFERLGDTVRLALIGHLSHDARQGQIVDFGLRDGARRVIVDAHPRIAAHRTADVDGDGHDDLLVVGFGDYPTGRVGIWWGGAENLQEQVLFTEAGTTWGDAADLDGDGDLDLVLAIANARPRLLAFVNEGGRRFVEALFEQLAGAIDVATGDFDRNGRMDLAVVAFYPDWRPAFPTTLLLLMQQPDGTVERAGIADPHWNRWMRIAAGDADGDGDLDLLLGAAEGPLAIPPEHAAGYQQLVQKQASALLLRNRTIP